MFHFPGRSVHSEEFLGVEEGLVSEFFHGARLPDCGSDPIRQVGNIPRFVNKPIAIPDHDLGASGEIRDDGTQTGHHIFAEIVGKALPVGWEESEVKSGKVLHDLFREAVKGHPVLKLESTRQRLEGSRFFSCVKDREMKHTRLKTAFVAQKCDGLE